VSAFRRTARGAHERRHHRRNFRCGDLAGIHRPVEKVLKPQSGFKKIWPDA
jgi:hypothetical protein